MVARDEDARDRTADEARDDKAEGRGGDADFERVGDPEPLRDDRRPGDCRAVSADQRGGAEKSGQPFGEAEHGDAAGRDEILDDEIGERQRQQPQKRAPARNQVVESCVEADAGEEIEQQQVARLQREIDLDAQSFMREQRRERGEQASGHRLRNVPAAQRRDQAIEPGAGEEHENRNRERQQSGDLDRCHEKSVARVRSVRR